MKVCHSVDFTPSFSPAPCRLTVSMDTGCAAAYKPSVVRKEQGLLSPWLWNCAGPATAHHVLGSPGARSILRKTKSSNFAASKLGALLSLLSWECFWPFLATCPNSSGCPPTVPAHLPEQPCSVLKTFWQSGAPDTQIFRVATTASLCQVPKTSGSCCTLTAAVNDSTLLPGLCPLAPPAKQKTRLMTRPVA